MFVIWMKREALLQVRVNSVHLQEHESLGALTLCEENAAKIIRPLWLFMKPKF